MDIKNWRIIAILFSVVVGSLLHFVYGWSGENRIVGAFSAVNESTWEHLKLAFFPMFIIAVIIGENIAYKIMLSDGTSNEKMYLGIIGILFTCFIIFTYFPPQIAYFKDPVTNTYGISN